MAAGSSAPEFFTSVIGEPVLQSFQFSIFKKFFQAYYSVYHVIQVLADARSNSSPRYDVMTRRKQRTYSNRNLSQNNLSQKSL